MARVRVSTRAHTDLKWLAVFLLEKGEIVAAARAMNEIADGIELLASAPALGRPAGDGTGRRVLTIPFGTGAYLIDYMLQDKETVVVLRVWHSRERRQK